jgi:hypothetical protein
MVFIFVGHFRQIMRQPWLPHNLVPETSLPPFNPKHPLRLIDLKTPATDLMARYPAGVRPIIN